MGLLDGNKFVLQFRLAVETASPFTKDDGTVFGLFNNNRLDSTEWMGFAPESCRVVAYSQVKSVAAGKTAPIDHAEFIVSVGHRPDGWLSDPHSNGRQRLNGWRLEKLDADRDGTLRDGHGRPLTEGDPAVWIAYRTFSTAEFNDCYFGEPLPGIN